MKQKLSQFKFRRTCLTGLTPFFEVSRQSLDNHAIGFIERSEPSKTLPDFGLVGEKVFSINVVVRVGAMLNSDWRGSS